MMNLRAAGSFDVKLVAQPHADGVGDPGIGRMALDKRFHGDLDASSLGQMLAFRSPVQGSAGYVAMERVTGCLHGRTGSFVLQHSGIMDRGAQQLSLAVVPDSGTDDLTGLSGNMKINIVDGRHSYEFDCLLPDSI